MKVFLSFLFVTASFSNVWSNPITATVVFENLTTETSIDGVFFILETNQQLPINSLETFTIEVPKKGKYQFFFYAENVEAYTYHPARITNKDHIITIRLETKTNKDSSALGTDIIFMPQHKLDDKTPQTLEESILKGDANFIIHGLLPINPSTFDTFKKTYGIGFLTENCVVDPISYNRAMAINTSIAKYLTAKFGEIWKDKLPAKPFGLGL